MPETWGMMSKSQTDSETIEEAITRIVATHEEDPDSHLGDGESLQSHKASAIIDHVVGSVASDKFSHIDNYHLCSFESLDNWTITGNVSLDGWPGVSLVVEPDVFDVSYMRSVVRHSSNYIDYTKIMFFQSVLWFDSEQNCKSWFGLGGYTSPTSLEGFGFYYYNGDLKGFWGKGATISYTSAITVDPTICHTYRAQYDPETQTVYFYIDGVQVASLTFETLPNDFEPQVFFRIDRLSYDDAFILNVRNVMISRTA